MGLLNNVTQSKYKVFQQDMTGEHVWSGLVDQDKLLLTNPDVKPWTDLTYLARIASANGDGTMAAARGSLSKEKTHLMHWLEGAGATVTVKDKWVKWKLFGKGEYKPIMLENIVESECPGIQNTDFAIKLDSDLYGRGDVIAPERNKRMQLIITEDGVPDGGGTKYRVKLLRHNGDPNAFFPIEYLNAGDYWCKIFSTTSEGGKGAGTLQVGNNFSFVEFQVNMSRGKWAVKVTDEAHRTNLVVAKCDQTTGTPDPKSAKIISLIEAQAMQQIEMEKEYWSFFGTQAKGITDKSSLKEFELGPGILSFLEDGNVFPYSIENGSINQIINYLNSVWFDRVSPGNRNVMFLGGQGFIETFDKWVRAEYAQSATVMHTDFVLKEAKSFSADQKGYGFPAYQFTEYYIAPFGKITIGHLPLFDSTYITSVREPRTGYPITSFEAIAFDIGLGNGKTSNVKLVKRENSEYYDYVCGMWTPAGPSNGQTKFRPAHTGQFYEMVYGIDFSTVVFDITLTMWLKPKYRY